MKYSVSKIKDLLEQRCYNIEENYKDGRKRKNIGEVTYLISEFQQRNNGYFQR